MRWIATADGPAHAMTADGPVGAPLRVLHVIAEFGLGGAERVVLMLIAGQRAAGDRVALAAAPGLLDVELPPGCDRYRIRDRGRTLHGAVMHTVSLVGALRRFRPQLIHTHGVRMLAIALVARGLAGRARVPILATHHATSPTDARWSGALLRRADHVVCVSHALRDRMVTAGFPPCHLSVIHNAVEPAAAARPDLVAALKDELGLAGGPVVAYVGRIEPQKRPSLFLDTARAIAAEDPAARFLVVGDGSLRASMERRARALGLQGAVRFAGPRRDVRAILDAADILLIASAWEGLSIAALEALAAGVPVIATPTDGMQELLDAGGGVVVEALPEALAAEVLDVLRHEERRRRISQRGREAVRVRFAPEQMLSRYREHYTRLVRHPRAPPGP